jgi:hypothetical protein
MRLCCLPEAAVVGAGLGGVTARRNGDGSRPLVGPDRLLSGQRAVGRAGTATTADSSARRQPVRAPVALGVMPWRRCPMLRSASSQQLKPRPRPCQIARALMERDRHPLPYRLLTASSY